MLAIQEITMNKIILFIVAIMFSNAIFICASGMTNNKYWNHVLHQTMPQELNAIRVIEKKDIFFLRKYGKSKKESEAIYNQNIQAYNQGMIHSYISADINKNGFEDVALSCIDEKKESFYLVILEKNEDKYRLIKYFKFDSIFFISVISNNYIDLAFQVGTDWVKQVYWNGKDYVLSEPGSMEP